MYTDVDKENAVKYAAAKEKLRLVTAIYKKAPHLASHLNIKLRDATNSDFIVLPELAKISKVVEVEITENLCTYLSCNPSKEKEPCLFNDVASYYYLGDNDFDLQCQPACFNLKPDLKNKIQSPQLTYTNNECRIVPPGLTQFLEKPYYRSSVIYERRVNDMPTGYSRYNRNESNNPGSNFGYKQNKTYCNYFDLDFLSNGECGLPAWGVAVEYSFGWRLINAIRSEKRIVFNNNIPFNLPEDLPKKPTEIPKKFTVEGWRKNINPTFEIPEIPELTKNILLTKRTNKTVKTDEFVTDFDTELNEMLKNTPTLIKLIAQFGFNYLTNEAIELIKKTCLSIVEQLSALLGKEATFFAQAIGSRTLIAALETTAIRSAVNISVQQLL